MQSFMKTIAVLALCSLGSAAAQAQQPRISGIFVTVEDNRAVMEREGGERLTITTAPNTGYARLDQGTAGDLKPGLFVGVGARPQSDGSQKAVQIVIFPDTMRGVGEGHRAWGVLPEATMTNGAIADTVQSVDGPNFTLNYKDGMQKVSTPKDASILLLKMADRSALKAGARGQVTGQRQGDGTIAATRITIWGDGVNPY